LSSNFFTKALNSRRRSSKNIGNSLGVSGDDRSRRLSKSFKKGQIDTKFAIGGLGAGLGSLTEVEPGNRDNAHSHSHGSASSESDDDDFNRMSTSSSSSTSSTSSSSSSVSPTSVGKYLVVNDQNVAVSYPADTSGTGVPAVNEKRRKSKMTLRRTLLRKVGWSQTKVHCVCNSRYCYKCSCAAYVLHLTRARTCVYSHKHKHTTTRINTFSVKWLQYGVHNIANFESVPPQYRIPWRAVGR
jgi:hypothetical protein